MFLFTIFAFPLGFFFLALIVFPQTERADAWRAFARGLFAFLPLLLVSAIASAAMNPGYGTILNIVFEWARIVAPSALVPLACYAIFYRIDAAEPSGAPDRRLAAFYAGALSPLGLIESIRIWERPDPYTLFIVPCILAAVGLAAPAAFRRMGRGGLAQVSLGATVSLLGGIALSTGHALFLARLGPLAALITMAILLGAWFFAIPALKR